MKIVLRDDGYEKITESLRAIENSANNGLLNPDKAHRFLQEIRGELYTLNMALREICLLAPEGPEQKGPNAA